MAEQDFVPFATGAGANVLSQSDYLANSQTTAGQQPGVASSALNNKALRQATSIAAAVAQFMSNVTGNNVLDDGNQSELLATMTEAFATRIAPTVQVFTSGSGTYTPPSGVLYLKVKMVGGGGGGCGSGTLASGGDGANGTNTTFGTAFLQANGGNGAVEEPGGAGGTASIGAGASGVAFTGSSGGSITSNDSPSTVIGGYGGSSPFGGGGPGGGVTNPGSNAVANTGSGGGGSGGPTDPNDPGSGGGAGGYLDAFVYSPTSQPYTVGAGGAGGTAGTSGFSGGNGAAGIIIVEEYYS